MTKRKTRSTEIFTRLPTLLVLGTIVVNLLSVGGCTSSETASAMEQETSNLKPLSVMYGMMGQPRSEKEFKAFVSSRAKTMFRAMEIESVDSLFVSKRDNQPYVILYGKRPSGVDSSVVGYEQEGVDGKRLVGFKIGEVRELDEQEFRALVPK